MFDWLRRSLGKPTDYVGSIDQLADSRGRDIARQVELDVDAIFPLCSQVNFEISQHRQHLMRIVADEDKEDVLSRYRLLLGAGAVLSYELSQRPSVTFPKPRSPQVDGVPRAIMSELRNSSYQARRIGLARHYDLMGRIFEESVRTIGDTIAQGRVEVDINRLYREVAFH